MHPMLNVAIQAIRKAGNFIVKRYELFDKKNTQLNYANDFVSKINEELYYITTTIIRKFYPIHSIITTWNTYNGDDINYKENVCWIIGSIDSNINFIKQFPFFALSVAVFMKGHIEIGVVYDPIHNELFSACRGKGAQLNGYRIRVSNTKNLHGAIVAISCAREQKNIIINILNKFYNECVYIRYTGATILDLAYVAAGRIDGCVAIFLEKIDNKLASGTLIIRESGGLIVDFSGIDNYLLSESIIAGNMKIIRTILSIIQIGYHS